MSATDVLNGQGRWSVEKADAMDFLRGLPGACVDLCMFSPPYEQARLYLENGEDLGIARNTEDWVAWMVDIIRECVRACRGLVCCVCEGQTRSYRWSAGPALLMANLARAGFNLRKPPVFHRVGIPGSGGPDWLRNDYEFCVCVARPGRLPWSDNCALGRPCKWKPGGAMTHQTKNGTVRPRLGRRMANGAPGSAKGGCRGRRVVRGHKDGDTATEDAYFPPERSNPGNVLHFKVGGGVMGHPLAHKNEAPYPLGLAEMFVRSFCPPGGVVCDPFSGSGTTGHAALMWGRRFIGCDLRESQCELTSRRLETITPTLFAE